MSSEISDELADELVSVCRTTIGDELRSITYFTPDRHDHVYLREDLGRGEDKQTFVETERMGFTSQRTYAWSELGDYDYTIRVFENGYLVRVISGEQGVYVTTDALTMNGFDELAEAVGEVLRAHAPAGDGADA